MLRVILHAMALTMVCSAAWAEDKPAPKPAAPAPAGEMTDAVEILKKADEAAKAIKSVKYTSKAKGLGTDETKLPTIEGQVILQGFKNGNPEKVRFEAKLSAPGSAEAKNVVMGTDGKEYFLIDNEKKIAYVDIDRAVVGSSGRMVTLLVMNEYGHDNPFGDEIKGEKKELKGSEKVGGEDCYHIYVKYAQAGQESDWYLSKKDFLPRRVDRKFTPQSGGEPGGRQLIVTGLTVEPKFDKDPFTFELPAGYTKSEDFAP